MTKFNLRAWLLTFFAFSFLVGALATPFSASAEDCACGEDTDGTCLPCPDDSN